MPAKSRRKRGKNLPPSIKAKTGAGTHTVESTSTVEAVPAATVTAAPVRKAPTSGRYAAQEEKTYPYIKPELWNIGILAVIMLVILGVLAAVL